MEYSATSVIQDNRKNALKTDFVLTFQNVGNKELEQISFKNDDLELEQMINGILEANPEYEVYNIMNVLFEKTIPKGYIYKVSKIVKFCAKIME